MSGESREGLVPSWWRNQTFPLSPEEQDLEYFRKNLLRGLRLGHPTKKLEKQIELLEDAIVIYRLHNSKKWIPQSLLVQTFMKELR